MTDNYSSLHAAVQKLMDVEDIRAYLNTLGLKGIRKNGRSCVLAEYFKRITHKSAEVGHKIEVWSGDKFQAFSLPSTLDYETYDIPDKLRDFIRAFDNGHFPELDLDGTREPFWINEHLNQL